LSNTALPYLAEVDFDIPKSKAGCPAKMSLSTVNYLQSSEDDFHQKKFNTHIKIFKNMKLKKIMFYMKVLVFYMEVLIFYRKLKYMNKNNFYLKKKLLYLTEK